MSKPLTRFSSRVFNKPHLIEPAKFEEILAAIGDRMGLAGAPGAWMDDTPASKPKALEVLDGIGVLPVEGTLVSKSAGMDALSGLTSYAALEADLAKLQGDSSVRGILLDIHSGGGEVAGLFSFARLIRASAKPVYAIAHHAAYSAAYLIAAAAERLYVTEDGGVGSIGTVLCRADFTKYDERQGLKYEFLYEGARKLDTNPHTELEDEGRKALKAEVSRLYNKFVAAVSDYRPLSEQVIRETEAGLYFGPAAVDARLADAIGTRAEALSALRARLDTNSGKRASVPNSPRKDTRMEQTEQQPAACAHNVDEIRAAAREEGRKAALADVDKQRTEAHQAGYTEALAYAGSIYTLCTTAGAAQMASDFIAKRTPAAEAGLALLKLKAQSDAPEIDTSHQPNLKTPTAPSNALVENMRARYPQSR